MSGREEKENQSPTPADETDAPNANDTNDTDELHASSATRSPMDQENSFHQTNNLLDQTALRENEVINPAPVPDIDDHIIVRTRSTMGSSSRKAPGSSDSRQRNATVSPVDNYLSSLAEWRDPRRRLSFKRYLESVQGHQMLNQDRTPADEASIDSIRQIIDLLSRSLGQAVASTLEGQQLQQSSKSGNSSVGAANETHRRDGADQCGSSSGSLRISIPRNLYVHSNPAQDHLTGQQRQHIESQSSGQLPSSSDTFGEGPILPSSASSEELPKELRNQEKSSADENINRRGSFNALVDDVSQVEDAGRALVRELLRTKENIPNPTFTRYFQETKGLETTTVPKTGQLSLKSSEKEATGIRCETKEHDEGNSSHLRSIQPQQSSDRNEILEASRLPPSPPSLPPTPGQSRLSLQKSSGDEYPTRQESFGLPPPTSRPRIPVLLGSQSSDQISLEPPAARQNVVTPSLSSQPRKTAQVLSKDQGSSEPLAAPENVETECSVRGIFQDSEERKQEKFRSHKGRCKPTEDKKMHDDDDEADSDDGPSPGEGSTSGRTLVLPGKSRKLSALAEEQSSKRHAGQGERIQGANDRTFSKGCENLGSWEVVSFEGSSKQKRQEKQIMKLVRSKCAHRPRNSMFLPRTWSLSILQSKQRVIKVPIKTGWCYNRKHIPEDFVFRSFSDLRGSGERKQGKARFATRYKTDAKGESEANSASKAGAVSRAETSKLYPSRWGAHHTKGNISNVVKISGTERVPDDDLCISQTDGAALPLKKQKVVLGPQNGKPTRPNYQVNSVVCIVRVYAGPALDEDVEIEAWVETPRSLSPRRYGGQNVIYADINLIYLTPRSMNRERTTNSGRSVSGTALGRIREEHMRRIAPVARSSFSRNSDGQSSSINHRDAGSESNQNS